MQKEQVLMVSENEALAENCQNYSFQTAQAGGNIPPGSLGTYQLPSVDFFLFGRVEIFLSARSSTQENDFDNSGDAHGGEALTEGKNAADTEEIRRKLAFVREYIFAHYAEKITKEKLAAFVFLTQDELDRLFRNHEGMDIPAFIENTRIERAAALLRGTGRTVSAIASEVGFADPAYFCRRFRKAYGMTPGQYRRKNVRNTAALKANAKP